MKYSRLFEKKHTKQSNPKKTTPQNPKENPLDNEVVSNIWNVAQGLRQCLSLSPEWISQFFFWRGLLL